MVLPGMLGCHRKTVLLELLVWHALHLHSKMLKVLRLACCYVLGGVLCLCAVLRP
jgi:hypothetical protein